jgi:hypothetical protein
MDAAMPRTDVAMAVIAGDALQPNFPYKETAGSYPPQSPSRLP